MKTSQDSDLLVRNRFSHDVYRISARSYEKILELIRFYHESIYRLPDEEYIEAEKIEDEKHYRKCNLRVNEIMFF